MSNDDIMIQLADSHEHLKARMKSLAEEILKFKSTARVNDVKLHLSTSSKVKIRQVGQLEDEAPLRKRSPK